MSDDLRAAIAKVDPFVIFKASDGINSIRAMTGGELADAILALPEMVELHRDAAVGRWVRENTNEWDRLNNPVVAGAWYVWEMSS